MIRGAFALLAISYGAAFTVKVLKYEGAYSPDSVVYIDTARNLLAGHGLSSSIAPLDSALKTDLALPFPMTTWAPLYPLLIALLHGMGLSITAAALVSPIACFGLVLVAAYLLIRALFNEGTAFLAVALLLLFAPLHTVATHAWSETVAIAAVLLSLYAVVRADQSKAAAPWVVCVGVAAGVALAARYAMAPLVVVVAIGLIQRKDLKRTAKHGIVFAIAFLFVAGPILVRNLWWSGRPLGMHPAGSGTDFAGIGAHLWQVTRDSARPRSLLGGLVLRLVIAVALIRCVLHLRARRLVPNGCMALVAQRRYLLLLWVALYLGMLVQGQLRFAIDPIDERLFAPAGVVLALWCVGSLTSLGGLRAWFPAMAALLLLGATCIAEVAEANAILHSRLTTVYDFEAKISRSEGLTWLAERVSDRDLVITENGYRLPLYMGPVNVLYFEPQSGAAIPLDYADFRKYIDRHRADYARVYVDLRKGSGATPLKGWGPFLDDLAAGHVTAYPGVTLEADLDDAIIYRIAPP